MPLAFTVSRRASHFSSGSPMFEALASGVGHKGAHVGVAWDTGPMAGEDAPTVWVLLALPHNAHSGAFEPEVEASDACE